MNASIDKSFMEKVSELIDKKLKSISCDITDDVYNWYKFLRNQCIQFLKEMSEETAEVSSSKMRGDVISYNIFAFASDEDFKNSLTDELVQLAKERDEKVGDWSVHM